MINQNSVFPVLAAAAAAAARYTIPSNITPQPSCLSTHSLCCAEHSCSMASSIPEPSPKLAPQQQMKSSPSAGFPQTICSHTVLSKKGCSRGPFTVEAVLMVTTLSFSLPFSPLLCAVRSWYAGCCCATRGLRVCSKVPLLPLYYIGCRIGVVCIGYFYRNEGGMGSSSPPPPSSGRSKKSSST